jgi:hypothetical protein
MNLQGSIIERQNSTSQIYRKLEDRFLENSIIRALWNDMALDISKQINSLKVLPASCWNQLKKDSDSQFESSANVSNKQSHENSEVMSLKDCFNLTLQIEESMILSIYVPIIRNLRGNWSNSALDFYIIVKSHVARIVSAIESFSGDPVLIQRAHVLLEKFEKEVQEHTAKLKPAAKKTPITHAVHIDEPKETPRKPLKPSNPITKHAKNAHNRAKPLVKKAETARKRAQR